MARSADVISVDAIFSAADVTSVTTKALRNSFVRTTRVSTLAEVREWLKSDLDTTTTGSAEGRLP